MSFFERLAARSRAIDSLVCVGLDPDWEMHRVDDLAAYLGDVVDATLPYTACYKPNIAFFEQHGSEGLRQFERLLAHIAGRAPVLCDAKRGDMANTATAYARALFETWDVDAATVNPYLGRDSLEPFLAYPDKGIFVLCRTSNPGAAQLQNRRLDTGELLYERIAVEASSWGANVGLVVGATAPAEMARIRRLVPETPFLVPGVGAQGGSPAEVVAAAGGTPGHIIISASRSVLYAGRAPDATLPPNAAEQAATAARALRDEINAARRAQVT
jgi:orotidine-5'-phosphate decarboxylase